MSRVLIIAEHDGSHLNPSTAKAVTCASGLPSAEITVAVLSDKPDAVAQQAAALAGVQKVLAVSGPAFAHPTAAALAPEVAALAAAGFTHLFAPSTTFGKDLLPRVSGLIGAPQLSDIMAVVSERSFRRPIYAGNAIQTVEVGGNGLILATVRSASFKAAPTGGNATVEAKSASTTAPGHTRYVGVSAAASDRPDLQTASRVVSGGRALGSAENFQKLYALADKLGAAVGASRAAVDAGYAPNDLQVGQTGKIIAPELYMAFGISGAIQHLTGIKDARTIVAVNKDAEAPIFEIADFGLVGDLFKIIPEIESLL